MGLVLVTGGAGFIGSHLVRGLLNAGSNVRVLDNLSSGSLENLAGLPIEFIRGDICQAGDVDAAVEGIEAAFHLAAFISAPDSVAHPVECYTTNILGSLNLLQAAARAKIARVVLASSAAVYGNVEGPITEDMPKRPASPYAVSKLSMEETARLFHRTYQLETVCLRFFNVYGPGQSPDSPYAAVIPQFIHDLESGAGITVLGDGGQTRDFVHVSDVVHACMLAKETPGIAGGTFNVANGSSTSILRLAEILHAMYPETPELEFGPTRPGDVRHSLADIERAATALGYRPQIVFEDGLAQTVEWFKRERR